MPTEATTVIEIDDEDFDFDEEKVVDEKPKKKKKSSIKLDNDMREAIIDIVNEETQDIRDEQAKLAKRVEKIGSALKEQTKVTSTLKHQNEAVLRAMARIDGSASELIDVEGKPTDSSVHVDEEKGIIGKTLGAIGSVAHGVIDTAAFVLESAVDLVTLGNARK